LIQFAPQYIVDCKRILITEISVIEFKQTLLKNQKNLNNSWFGYPWSPEKFLPDYGLKSNAIEKFIQCAIAWVFVFSNQSFSLIHNSSAAAVSQFKSQLV